MVESSLARNMDVADLVRKKKIFAKSLSEAKSLSFMLALKECFVFVFFPSKFEFRLAVLENDCLFLKGCVRSCSGGCHTAGRRSKRRGGKGGKAELGQDG